MFDYFVVRYLANHLTIEQIEELARLGNRVEISGGKVVGFHLEMWEGE